MSPVSVAWTQQLGSDLPLAQWLKKVKLEAYYCDEFSPVEVTYAWQNGMSYENRRETKAALDRGIFRDKKTGQARAKPGFDFSTLPRVRFFTERACDQGKVFSVEENNKGGASLVIDSLDNPRFWEKNGIMFLPAYFREAGFVLPNTIATQRDGAKSLPLASLELGAKLSKVQQTRLDGRTCLLLELEDKDLSTRFYLDPSAGYALCRREEVTRAGRLALVSAMSDFVQFHHPDICLPKRCDVAYYAWRTLPGVITEKPLATRTFVVHAIDKHPLPVGRFSLKHNAPVHGWWIRRCRKPSGRRREACIMLCRRIPATWKR